MSPRPPPPLVALSAGDLDPARADELVIAVARAVSAGLRGVLLREPTLADQDLLEVADRLAAVLTPTGGWLALHDRAHLAHVCGAAAVHLGFRSLTPDDARRVVGRQVALGLSTHAGDGPDTWAGCDYRFFGPVHDTPSKRGLLEPTGIDGLAAACALDDLPVWAIGGLLPEHAAAARGAGAAGVAVRAGLLGAPDPAAATAAYLEALA